MLPPGHKRAGKRNQAEAHTVEERDSRPSGAGDGRGVSALLAG